MSKSKIVDLVVSDDGTYSPKFHSKKPITKAITKLPKSKQQEFQAKTKYNRSAGADEFLSGLDAGLDFVEAIKSRALRVIGLRD